MSLRLVQAITYTFEQLALIFERAFANYFVEVAIDGPNMADLVRRDLVDLNRSRVIQLSEESVGLALIAKRGRASRLAAMGLFEAHRGKGLGKKVMNALLLEAEDAGDTQMELEVIEQNIPGLRLYQACGFEQLDRLLGWELKNVPPSKGDAAAPIIPIPLLEGVRFIAAHGAPTPWQSAPESLLLGNNEAWRTAEGVLITSSSDKQPILLKGIAATDMTGITGNPQKVLSAWMSHLGMPVRASAIWPSAMAPALFEPLGFSQTKLSQIWMRRCLIR